MCRNIKTLFNYNPPVTEDEIRASAIQYVRKVSGYQSPSRANEAAFNTAVDRLELITKELIDSLVTTSSPRNREVEAIKSKLKYMKKSNSNAS